MVLLNEELNVIPLHWYPDKIPPEKVPPKKIPLNAVEREPVPTRVLNPTASKASYKPKQRSYGKTKLKKLYNSKKNTICLIFFIFVFP